MRFLTILTLLTSLSSCSPTKTLKLNDKVDVEKINKLFDRIAQTQASIWKETFKKEQEIKSMLNERQLIMHEKIINRSFRNAKKANPINKR